jgi:uncharacterized protein YgiM (DUF1202 family)
MFIRQRGGRVNKSKQVNGRWLVILIFAAFLINSCLLTQESTKRGKNTEKSSNESNPIKPGHVDSGIFPSFMVSGNSCYVFLKPTSRSDYFGPLKKGEKINQIETQGGWIRVWIPRLRTSGWVDKEKIFEIKQKTLTPGGIPLDILDTVTVISSRANIRKAPTTSASKIHLAKRNERFVVLAESDGWYEIWVAQIKKKGWIYGKIVNHSGNQ